MRRHGWETSQRWACPKPLLCPDLRLAHPNLYPTCTAAPTPPRLSRSRSLPRWEAVPSCTSSATPPHAASAVMSTHRWHLPLLLLLRRPSSSLLHLRSPLLRLPSPPPPPLSAASPLRRRCALSFSEQPTPRVPPQRRPHTRNTRVAPRHSLAGGSAQEAA